MPPLSWTPGGAAHPESLPLRLRTALRVFLWETTQPTLVLPTHRYLRGTASPAPLPGALSPEAPSTWPWRDPPPTTLPSFSPTGIKLIFIHSLDLLSQVPVTCHLDDHGCPLPASAAMEQPEGPFKTDVPASLSRLPIKFDYQHLASWGSGPCPCSPPHHPPFSPCLTALCHWEPTFAPPCIMFGLPVIFLKNLK